MPSTCLKYPTVGSTVIHRLNVPKCDYSFAGKCRPEWHAIIVERLLRPLLSICRRWFKNRTPVRVQEIVASRRICTIPGTRQRMTTKGIEKYTGKGSEAGASEEWLLQWRGLVTDSFQWGSFCCSFGQTGFTVSNSIGDCVNMDER